MSVVPHPFIIISIVIAITAVAINNKTVPMFILRENTQNVISNTKSTNNNRHASKKTLFYNGRGVIIVENTINTIWRKNIIGQI